MAETSFPPADPQGQSEKTRPWYAKKRFIIPSAAVALFIVIGVLNPAEPDDADDASSAEQAQEPTSPVPGEPEPQESTTVPSSEPTPERTTPAPVPEPEPEPEPTPEPVPEGRTYEGEGSSVVMLEDDMDQLWTVDVTHQGDRNFAIWAVDSSGQNVDLLVNTIGDYSGLVGLNITGREVAALDVEASGPWSVRTQHITEMDRWNGSGTYDGWGDYLVAIDPFTSGMTIANIVHEGDSGNFVVRAWAEHARGPALLVNEIGHYSGQDLLPDGTFVLEVTATGSWSVTVE